MLKCDLILNDTKETYTKLDEVYLDQHNNLVLIQSNYKLVTRHWQAYVVGEDNEVSNSE